MIKRSDLLKTLQLSIKENTSPNTDLESLSEEVLSIVEKYMEPKVRPLTDDEVENHVLVKQVHHSRKDEVRNYVRNLDYEWKREYLPEEEK